MSEFESKLQLCVRFWIEFVRTAQILKKKEFQNQFSKKNFLHSNHVLNQLTSTKTSNFAFSGFFKQHDSEANFLLQNR